MKLSACADEYNRQMNQRVLLLKSLYSVDVRMHEIKLQMMVHYYLPTRY